MMHTMRKEELQERNEDNGEGGGGGGSHSEDYAKTAVDDEQILNLILLCSMIMMTKTKTKNNVVYDNRVRIVRVVRHGIGRRIEVQVVHVVLVLLLLLLLLVGVRWYFLFNK